MFNLSTLPYLTVVTTDRRRRCYETGILPTVNTASRGSFECPKCQKTYKWYRGLHRHLKYECGKAPRFQCPHCMYTGKHRSHVYSHIKSNHSDRPIYALDTQQGWSVYRLIFAHVNLPDSMTPSIQTRTWLSHALIIEHYRYDSNGIHSWRMRI